MPSQLPMRFGTTDRPFEPRACPAKNDFRNQLLIMQWLTRTKIADCALLCPLFIVYWRIRLTHASAIYRPVETHSVEEGEKNHDESTDAECGERFEFIRDLCQECRNISSTVFCCLTRFYKHRCTTIMLFPTTVAFDRCSTVFLPRRWLRSPSYLQERVMSSWRMH